MRAALIYIVSSLYLVTGFHIQSKPIRCSSPCLYQAKGEPILKDAASKLDEEQLDFTLGYLNKHHSDMLVEFAKAFSSVGAEQVKQNTWSGGSYKIEGARISKLDTNSFELDVSIQKRNENLQVLSVVVDLDAHPVSERKRHYDSFEVVPQQGNVLAIDSIVRRLCRLCWIVKKPEVTGKLIQLAIQLGGKGIGKLPENMYLNQVPHGRYVRRYFYDSVATAAIEACVLCSQGIASNRMKIVSMFPEMNPSMDSYRIGTLLELTRTVAIRLAEQNLRVRICVQGSMGVGIFTGLPKQLSGVSKLLQMMDWQSGEGEENEGMVGNYVNFGGIGEDHVVNAHTEDDGKKIEQDDVFLLLCPQSMVGIESSIMEPLSKMVDAAGDRPVILINPDLSDKRSSQGQQGVRGRAERIAFAESFNTIYHFQNIYVSGTSYFPILGSITKLGPSEQWVAHQRRDRTDRKGEIYIPLLAAEEIPSGAQILDTFEN